MTPAYIALSVACTLLLISGPTLFRRLRSAHFEQILIHGRGAMPGLSPIKPLGDRLTGLEEGLTSIATLISSTAGTASSAAAAAAGAASAAAAAASTATIAAKKADEALIIAKNTQIVVLNIEKLLTTNGGDSLADDVRATAIGIRNVESRLTEST